MVATAPSASATKWTIYDTSNKMGETTTLYNLVLPLSPQRVTYEAAADVREVSFPTKNNSLLISLGKKVNKLTLTGVLAEGGSTAETLYDNYIVKLKNLMRYNTYILMPSGVGDRYNGAWLLNRFQYEETGGYTVSFKYTLEFIQGVGGDGTTAPGIVI